MLNYDFEELEDKKNASQHVFMQFSMMNNDLAIQIIAL